jgi:hypothetical protein
MMASANQGRCGVDWKFYQEVQDGHRGGEGIVSGRDPSGFAQGNAKKTSEETKGRAGILVFCGYGNHRLARCASPKSLYNLVNLRLRNI